ncbi:MAG: transposase, partial [Legionellaceae bacterium]|nr:transposase [Legionellaceae bacterium]
MERELKDTNASADEIYDRRQKESLPLLENLKEWLYSNSYKTPPKSSLGKAIAYSINHWESLINYTKDGRLEIDNNRSERSIKPFVIGRNYAKLNIMRRYHSHWRIRAQQQSVERLILLRIIYRASRNANNLASG